MNTQEMAEMIFHHLRKKQATPLSKVLEDYNRGEVGVLSYLFFDKDNVTSGSLSEELNVTTARIASILNSLESKGLIKRKTDEFDKRKTLVTITEKGKELVNSVEGDVIKNIVSVIEGLGVEDAKEYIRLSTKIRDILSKQ